MWPDADRPLYGIFVKRQIDALQEKGIRCDVIYLRGYVSTTVYALAALRLLWASVSWRGRYRLVHVHAGETGLAARCFVGPPMIATFHGDDILGDRRVDGTKPLISRVRSALVRAHAWLFTATVAQSEEMHRSLRGRARRRNSVIPCGVDASSFRTINRSAARRSLGWPEYEPVVLFVAMRPNRPSKRLWLAEAAIAEASAHYGPIRLHVAGATAPDEVPLLMNAADCLLHTSCLEGSPNVVREALMCNLPVVATSSGDVEQLLSGVEPSFLCPPEPAALGDALVDCLTRGTRSNGRDRKAAELSSEATTERLLDLYEQLGLPRQTASRNNDPLSATTATE
jgi:glycosyltransferase involved in cell wall biosynthesis